MEKRCVALGKASKVTAESFVSSPHRSNLQLADFSPLHITMPDEAYLQSGEKRSPAASFETNITEFGRYHYHWSAAKQRRLWHTLRAGQIIADEVAISSYKHTARRKEVPYDGSNE